jgi:hypothetical protein
MARSQSARAHTLEVALSALVGLALVSCGTTTGAGSAGNGQVIPAAPVCVAPIEGSPEEAAFAMGHCSRSSWYVAPIEGTPEQTVADEAR